MTTYAGKTAYVKITADVTKFREAMERIARVTNQAAAQVTELRAMLAIKPRLRPEGHDWYGYQWWDPSPGC